MQEGICYDDTSITIEVFPSPEAAYFATQSVGCEGLEVNFMENASNGATAFIWDFGDGTPVVNERNPRTCSTMPEPIPSKWSP